MLGIGDEISSSFFGYKELLEIYNELDYRIEFFKKVSGIDCIKNCGKCCKIPSYKIETSIFEVIPLAIHLWEKGEAEIFLERLNRVDRSSLCIFYKDNLTDKEKGHCYVYPFRPLICRLFGFSAIEDKYGRPIIILCSIVKKEKPEKCSKIKAMIEEGLDLPINSFYAKRIALLNPVYGKELYPINEAIRIGIELVGYRVNLFREERDESDPLHPYRRAA